MDNKRGETAFGYILIAFMAIVVGVAFFVVIAQTVGDSTNTVAIVNQTLGVADNATTVTLTNMRAISDVVIYNESGTEIVPADNYTVTNNVVTDGALTVTVLPDGANDAAFQGYTWTISGTSQPVDYIADSGARSVALLITIFFALAIAVVALTPTLKAGVLDLMGR